MKKTIGKVLEVYIPNETINDALVDVMDRKFIGFNIETDGGIKTVEEEQNEDNCLIMKDDMVEIIEQNISGINFVDIRLYDGD